MHPALTVFLAVLSTLFVPLPEELTLLGAGYAARAGELSPGLAFAMAWLGVMVGDWATFFGARALLPRILRTKLGQRLLAPEQRAWAERLVTRRGATTIVIARFLVGLRGPVYMALGASRYPRLRFMAINGIVGVAEVGALVAAGFALGKSDKLVHGVREIEIGVAAILIFALGVPLLLKRFVAQRA